MTNSFPCHPTVRKKHCSSEQMCRRPWIAKNPFIYVVPGVVQRVDSNIHWINHYQLDNTIHYDNTDPLSTSWITRPEWQMVTRSTWWIYSREQCWRSCESTGLPPMWPGFGSRIRRNTLVEFVGSLLCSERFSPGYSGFPVSPKTNIWFDLICVDLISCLPN